MINKLSDFKPWQKTATAIIHDTLIAIFALYAAIAVRFGQLNPKILNLPDLPKNFIFAIIIQVITFYLFGLYQGIWRYSSTSDLIRVIKASTIAVLASFVALFLTTRLDAIPRALVFINWAFLVLGLGGGRFVYRILRDHYVYRPLMSKGRKNILIVGAGSGGEQLFREIRKNAGLGLFVTGFVDDSPSLKSKYLHGVPVLGSTSDLPELIKQTKIQSVFIAIPSAKGEEVRRIYDLISPTGVEVKILPKMSEIFNKEISLANLQNIKIEDLLGREEVNIDLALLKDMLQHKRVLVTGAGGSIGAELCHQLAKFDLSCLVALDVSEFNSYTVDQELRSKFPALNLKTIVGDVRDQSSMQALFESERPEVVLHAAAYKHVPMMEFNPFECIRTNVYGTQVTAELAARFQVERFVLISTDKAVNPTNVMGCSKRLTEILLQNLQTKTVKTKFVTVRFGNVLGSSGSVIPHFRKQIEEGGPLTVTHPEITRYFMSIPEATKLVLQAGAMGLGGELFVLDMGQPVKILDLAHEMIRLAGLRVDIDIPVKISGLRPGEKLFEEPLANVESCLSTPHSKVKICKARGVPENFTHELSKLLQLNHQNSREDYIALMKSLVEEYSPYEGEPPTLNQLH